MRILGLETATAHAAVGLLADGVVVAERSQLAAASHAVTVLPLIAETLASVGWTAQDLDAIAVSAGPGTFTGLRVGLSVAKGLAFATGIPVVGVATLEALARTAGRDDGIIWTVLDARKGEVYAASFAAVPGTVQRLTPDMLLTPAALVEQIVSTCVVAGDALDRYGALFAQCLGDRATLLTDGPRGPRGGIVAAMGALQLAGGAVLPLADVEPLYVRASDAERHRAVAP